MKKMNISIKKLVLIIIITFLMLYIVNDLTAPYRMKMSTGSSLISSSTIYYVKLNSLGIKTITLPFQTDELRRFHVNEKIQIVERGLDNAYDSQNINSDKVLNEYIANIYQQISALPNYQNPWLMWLIISKDRYFVEFSDEKAHHGIYEYLPKENMIIKIKDLGKHPDNIREFEVIH